jgi:N-acetylglucosaminyl-diphospho-decaprenol L-rhamnosyltransferase
MAWASLVVVTWECADELRGLVDSMNRHLPPGAELVVVDNASTDDPRAAAEEWEGELRFIGLGGNGGYGRAANAGVAAAGAQTVVLLNPDARLTGPGLDALAAEAASRQALVGPRVLHSDSSPEPSASGPPVGVWPWVAAVAPGSVLPRALGRRTAPWRLDSAVGVAWLSASCLAAPRALLRDLGPFDPQIEMYGEDLDLGLRAGRAGIDRRFDPTVCTVLHAGQASSSRRYRDRGAAAAAAGRRAVLARAFGAGRERRSWAAWRAGLALRVAGRRLMRRPDPWASLALAGARACGEPPHLDPFDADEARRLADEALAGATA